MDQVKPDLKVVQSAALETSKRTLNTSADFRVEVAKLIVKVRLACSLPALETAELAATVEAWCEVLSSVVPVERLNDSYVFAMRHRTSTYPLAATEIVTAWRSILSDEIARRRPCALCHGTGFGLIYDPKTDTEIQKECPHCFGRIQTGLQRTV